MDTIPAIFLKDGGEFAGLCECGLVQENFLCIDVQQVAQPLQGDQDMGGGGRGRGEGVGGGGGGWWWCTGDGGTKEDKSVSIHA